MHAYLQKKHLTALHCITERNVENVLIIMFPLILSSDVIDRLKNILDHHHHHLILRGILSFFFNENMWCSLMSCLWYVCCSIREKFHCIPIYQVATGGFETTFSFTGDITIYILLSHLLNSTFCYMPHTHNLMLAFIVVLKKSLKKRDQVTFCPRLLFFFYQVQSPNSIMPSQI